ncbi:MAG TPA: chromosomal replication initiator protein DnaA, partial [Chloroflexota bacterium]
MDKRQVWQAVLGELELQVTRPNFDTWLRDTWLVGEEDGVCTVAVGKPMALEWVESRFGTLVKKTLRSILGRPVEVRFVPGTSRVDPSPPMDLPLARVAAPTPTERPRPASEGSPLNPRYTFSTFVVGNSNRLAHAACQAVAERPASAYNPLFIYGGVGLGKTHLLHAIGNECLRRGLRVVYVSSETFTNELIEAIREHRTDDFRRKYRSVSVLLIDDIQFIASKERTQEEFFHTFNSVHEANGQIVLSSDRPPKAIPTLEDRLRSR